MKKIFSTLIFIAFSILISFAQERVLMSTSEVITQHKTLIKGTPISYTAACGTQPVWNEKGKVTASLFYTYYTRDGISDRSSRPLVISFNGGPGSASVWMHIAYTGPMVIHIDEEGYPLQPYGVKQNPHSILDVADIVFVNPVNTGYSRIIDPEERKVLFLG